MILQLRCELHEDLLRRDRVAQLLDHLLDLVVELGLRADYVEAIDQLGHYLTRIVAILSRHHAHKQHNALNQTRVLKVQVDDQALEDVLVLFNQIFAELLEELCVPLDDSLLFFSALSLHLVILFLEPVEDILELILVSQYLDDSPKESSIDVLDQAFAIDVIDLF